MAELRRTTGERPTPQGPIITRGYEVVEDGEPRPPARLAPEAFDEIAVVDVQPASPEERQAMAFPAFGVDRTVTLRTVEVADGRQVEVLDADGQRRAGRIVPETAAATAELLAQRPDLATWVVREELGETGRTGLAVAISRPELQPQPLARPAQTGATGGLRALLADRRVWVAVGLAVVVAIAVLVTG
ncbi:hypothetical protein ER308_11660 [Egibacter rhizosphaerae]|uniref:Uncharacterized protein n=1 Tax=Egibacter rhizosphaerae TaxID=1670831 RepID=A0A411YG04_9ACTN|nr:hypothetical protein [Egibacter rhizosphaerae]QBI20153.1 hypothetical protein ER308_11660 [Egibacter rhizosphaerae]